MTGGPGRSYEPGTKEPFGSSCTCRSGPAEEGSRGPRPTRSEEAGRCAHSPCSLVLPRSPSAGPWGHSGGRNTPHVFTGRRETPSGKQMHFQRMGSRGGGHAWDLGRGFFREKSRQLNLEGERDRTHEEGGEWGTGRAHFGLRGRPLRQLQRQEATGSGDSITLPAPRPGLAASPRGWPILNPAPGNFSLRPGVPCHCPALALPGLGCRPQRPGWRPRPPDTGHPLAARGPPSPPPPLLRQPLLQPALASGDSQPWAGGGGGGGRAPVTADCGPEAFPPTM